MKQTKRILSLLLSLCLVLGLIPGTAFAAGGNLPFTDVNTTDWCYDAVQYVYEKGMMNGTSTTTFSPDSTTTRGMIVTILHRMEGTPAATGTAFTDVPAGQWYSDAVSWASANGIVGGYGNGLFGSNDPITREQMVAILNRYSMYKGYDTAAAGSITGFADAAQVISYAVEPMGWAIGNGLISGTGNNTLVPKGNATRAQAAMILMRFCQNIADKANSTPAPDTAIEKTYTVTFNLNYGSDTRYDVKTVKEGDTVSKPTNPSRSGYSFSGWYVEKSGGRQFDFKTGITSDLTLYAHWSSSSGGDGNSGSDGYVPPSTTFYTVTFYMNDGTDAVHTTSSVVYGGAVSAPSVPARSGYIFDGWYTDAATTTAYSFSSPVTRNFDLYAKWIENTGPESPPAIPEEIKEALGLSKDTDDSDGDGLTDYQELIIVGTDPTKYDTNNDGIRDADGDEDGDGLSNITEVQLGTLPTAVDSDFDGLTDSEEVNIYATNPLVADSDGDGLTDGEEIKLGLDPMNPQTDGHTPDAERTFNQVASNSIKDQALLDSDNWLVPLVEGNVPGDIEKNIILEKSSTSVFNDNRAALSDIIELSTNYETTPLTLSFAYNETYTGSMNSLTIASFGENGLEIIDTYIDEDKLSGQIVGSGTYFVLDLDEFLKGLGINVLDNIISPAAEPVPDTTVGTSSEDTEIDYLYDNDGNVIEQVVDDTSAAGTRIVSVARPLAASSEATGKADVVFVIDTTGSMSGAIYGVKENVNAFAEKLVSDYNVDANFALIEFRDITVDGLDSTKHHKNITSNWFTNVGILRDEVNHLSVGGGGDNPETPIDGLEMARRLDWRGDAAKFIILVTDAGYKVDNQYGISGMDEMIRLLNNDSIIVSAISYSESLYRDLVGMTDGLYGYIYGDFSDILLQLADKIGEMTNADGEWVFLDDFQAVKLSDTLDHANFNDTDGDGLTDAQELGTSVVVDMLPYIRSLTNRYDVPVENYQGKTHITVWEYLSNPVRCDTDYDGYMDKDDRNPRRWDISDRDLAIAAGISYNNLARGTKINTSSSINLGSGASAGEMVEWTVLDTWHGGAGFYAAALKKDKNIILAFRGSKGSYDGFIDIDWIDDWIFADVINVMTGISTQAPAAQAFTEQIVNNYSGYNIYICGHSLGGNLALNASIKALKAKPSVVKRVSTFNGLGMPNVKILTELFTWDLSTLASYKERFYDYEIEGDPVSAFELKPDHNWWDIFDIAVTTGVGYRIVLPLKVSGNAHGLENFYLQLEPLGRPIR